jgi:membrane protein involved in colicin uptake
MLEATKKMDSMSLTWQQVSDRIDVQGKMNKISKVTLLAVELFDINAQIQELQILVAEQEKNAQKAIQEDRASQKTIEQLEEKRRALETIVQGLEEEKKKFIEREKQMEIQMQEMQIWIQKLQEENEKLRTRKFAHP